MLDFIAATFLAWLLSKTSTTTHVEVVAADETCFTHNEEGHVRSTWDITSNTYVVLHHRSCLVEQKDRNSVTTMGIGVRLR